MADSKRRLVLPWSMQASHQRSLEKAGKHYTFGSFKYTAQTLYDRGILLSIDQYSPKQFDRIALTISSNDVGVFEVEASYMGIPVTTVELRLEELLEMQFVSFALFSLRCWWEGVTDCRCDRMACRKDARLFR